VRILRASAKKIGAKRSARALDSPQLSRYEAAVTSGNAMLRLFDQPRPIAWRVMRPFSLRYSTQYDARHLPDWKRIVMRRGVYVPELGLLYVLNAKAASSTLRDLMYTLSGGSGQRGPVRGLRWPTPEWRELVGSFEDPTVFKFTSARHPVDRAVSTFFNMFVDRKNGFEWRHIPYMGRTGLKFRDPSSANFDRFLNYTEEAQAESELFCDEHLRLQVHNVSARHMKYDRVVHFETLPEDVHEVMSRAGVNTYRDELLGWVNRSSAKDSGFAPTREQVSRIERIYAEDYERLGYS
jgi:hypothetical protein